MQHLQAIASVGGQQRCANARAKYKRPCGVNPTIFVNQAAEWAAEQPGDGEEGDGAGHSENGAEEGETGVTALNATDTATAQTVLAAVRGAVLAAVREGEEPVGRRASRRLAGHAAPLILQG